MGRPGRVRSEWRVHIASFQNVTSCFTATEYYARSMTTSSRATPGADNSFHNRCCQCIRVWAEGDYDTQWPEVTPMGDPHWYWTPQPIGFYAGRSNTHLIDALQVEELRGSYYLLASFQCWADANFAHVLTQLVPKLYDYRTQQRCSAKGDARGDGTSLGLLVPWLSMTPLVTSFLSMLNMTATVLGPQRHYVVEHVLSTPFPDVLNTWTSTLWALRAPVIHLPPPGTAPTNRLIHVVRDEQSDSHVGLVVTGSQRVLNNLEALVTALEEREFATVRMGALSLADRVRLLKSVDVLVTQSGANMLNLAFAAMVPRRVVVIDHAWPELHKTEHLLCEVWSPRACHFVHVHATQVESRPMVAVVDVQEVLRVALENVSTEAETQGTSDQACGQSTAETAWREPPGTACQATSKAPDGERERASPGGILLYACGRSATETFAASIKEGTMGVLQWQDARSVGGETFPLGVPTGGLKDLISHGYRYVHIKPYHLMLGHGVADRVHTETELAREAKSAGFTLFVTVYRANELAQTLSALTLWWLNQNLNASHAEFFAQHLCLGDGELVHKLTQGRLSLERGVRAAREAGLAVMIATFEDVVRDVCTTSRRIIDAYNRASLLQAPIRCEDPQALTTISTRRGEPCHGAACKEYDRDLASMTLHERVGARAHRCLLGALNSTRFSWMLEDEGRRLDPPASWPEPDNALSAKTSPIPRAHS